ncbi:YihA family ribosome biogenesis GTP-binding protein [bacterium]|nr:YihA family ribosome biogenesis GTP-binding protein [bacterium]
MTEPSVLPADDWAAWEERGRVLFAGQCEHFTAAPSVEFLPPQSLPEIAFIGRSNVGKSSLLNALTGRNSLARTSSTPGCTKMLHFYDLAQKLFLVDVPGYGFHKASKKEGKQWQRLIVDYLRGRAVLGRSLLLLDSRHGVKPNDKELMDFLDDLAVPYQVVLTKGDELKKSERAAVIEAVQMSLKKHSAAMPNPILTSSRDGDGIPQLRASLAALIARG